MQKELSHEAAQRRLLSLHTVVSVTIADQLPIWTGLAFQTGDWLRVPVDIGREHSLKEPGCPSVQTVVLEQNTMDQKRGYF